jgi:hypothetical protein
MIKPILYRTGLTKSGGANRFRNTNSFSFRNWYPSLPTMATPMIIKTSGIPSANNPDTALFNPIDQLVEATEGINNGLKNPTTITVPPMVNLVFDI